MNSDLLFILMALGVGVLAGTPLALYVIKFRRNWREAWVRIIFSLNWWMFLSWVVMFAALGVYFLQQDKPYSAAFFFFLGGLNLWSLVACGLRTPPATPAAILTQACDDLTTAGTPENQAERAQPTICPDSEKL